VEWSGVEAVGAVTDWQVHIRWPTDVTVSWHAFPAWLGKAWADQGTSSDKCEHIRDMSEQGWQRLWVAAVVQPVVLCVGCSPVEQPVQHPRHTLHDEAQSPAATAAGAKISCVLPACLPACLVVCLPDTASTAQ
jgi:hypothetical protein